MTEPRMQSSEVSYMQALKAPLSRADIRAMLTSEPAWSPDVRSLPMIERQMGVMSLSKAFFPLPAQCRLAEELQLVLHSGYANRHGVIKYEKPKRLRPTSNKVTYEYELINTNLIADNSHLSGCLLGFPGTGKSTVVQKTMPLFAKSQIERHEKLSPQIAWLTMSCPIGPTLKSFCIAFLDALGTAIGNTEVTGVFAHGTAAVDRIPGEIENLARNHAIGILVVDDIQHLRAVNNGEEKQILGLLETLSGKAGVPVLLVGTNAAAEVVCNSPRTALRSVGVASEVWERIPKGPEWDDFFGRLWRYQWTCNETELTAPLSEIFHDRSQGIASLAVKLYQRTQSAIIRQADLLKNANCVGEEVLTRDEIITPAFVEAVSEFLFAPVQPLLDALRSRDPAKLFGFEDFRPLPSEAKRMKAEKEKREAAEEQRHDSDEMSDTPASDDEEADRTDEEIEQIIKTAQMATKELLEMGREVFREARCTDEEIDSFLAEITDVLGDKIHEKRRKFFAEIEGRLKLRNSKIRRADDPAARQHPSQFAKDDLRRILWKQSDILSNLQAAKIDGRTGLMLVV